MQLARGETKTFTFTCTDDDGEPIILEGASIAFTVRDLAGEAVIELTDEDDEVTIGEDGVFTVKIEHAVSKDLDPTARWADCFVVTAADPPQHIQVLAHEPFYVTATETVFE